MKEKYGFIYIWYDRKRKMYYIGCHWGTVDDGYICSSNRMRDAYRRRPYDFKRRIIQKNISRENLLIEEHRWLSMISDQDLGKKYYNLQNHHFGHWCDNENKKIICKNISVYQKQLVENGTHPWLGNNNPSRKKMKNGTHPWLKADHKEKTRQIQYKKVKDNIHPFLGGKISKETNRKRVENGTHNFLDAKWQKESSERRSATWEITFPDGSVIIRKNLKSFCKENNLNQGAMNQVGLGKISQHKGFKCKKLKKGEIRGKGTK